MYAAEPLVDGLTDMIPFAPTSNRGPLEAKGAARASALGLQHDVMVVKIGGSVLRSTADAATAASEIYRLRRRGARIVAVVSAVNGHTDALFQEADAHGERATPHARRLVGLGEERSAALTALACERVGLRARVLTAVDLALRAEGDPDAATPAAMNLAPLRAALETQDVVIVPGFTALKGEGEPVLLGRGGSDMTAVFIAAEAGLDAVRLVKDVDGVYDCDPAVAGAAARRFEAMTYAEARHVGGAVVQDRAVAFAQTHDVTVDVAAVGAERATRIGHATRAPSPVQTPRRLKIAVAGCGVVGGGLLAHLARRPEAFEVCAVLVRDPSKRRDVPVDASVFVTHADAVFASEPDIVVDAVSSGEDGHALIARALAAGVHVVSANKQAVVTDLPGLAQSAADTQAGFLFSAAVGGSTPMVETIRWARTQGDIIAFEAVLNGTVNFILDRMAQGVAFDAALQEAREAGFAEEDPSADLEGLDAAAKVRILAQEAFGAAPEDAAIPRDMLNEATCARVQQAGGLWKQLGCCHRAEDGTLSGDVRITPADDAPLFRHTVRERNALRVTMADGRIFTAEGRGAGRWPTAEAVLADIMDMRAQILQL